MSKTGRKKTYLSLFSGAGLGCYGFKQEMFECIATVEIMSKRLMFQKFNEKCKFDSGYINGDISESNTKENVWKELKRWKISEKNPLDVLIATPPCQGMSVANHKKGNELLRNSLIVESIKWVSEINPNFFIFENVRSFLKTECTDVDGVNRPIGDAIELNLAGKYNIYSTILNFKDYGCPSSRTRTLVIGIKKTIKDITPIDILPDISISQTLRETIGHLPSLKTMGEIYDEDIYHNFKPYKSEMTSWISGIKEGESAFDNKDKRNIPHKKVGAVRIYNTNKNGDKYKRQFWDKVAPCVHTRNDILSSQNTVHPSDNRVFSIREIMLMMSVPNSFRWSEIPFKELNSLNIRDKRKFLTKNEMNIRHSIGEGVPTIIFNRIAKKINEYYNSPKIDLPAINTIIEKYTLNLDSNLNRFVDNNPERLNYSQLSKVSELANTLRAENAAYYTSQEICYSIIRDLPDFKKDKTLYILEPAIGIGNFLPLLFAKYKDVKEVVLDLCDIDENSLNTLNVILKHQNIPSNFHLNIIHADFLLHKFDRKYDLIIGNPPYKKLKTESSSLEKYKMNAINTNTNNIFSFFIEKALKIGDVVSFIVPKSLISTPEFNKTRELLNSKQITKIIDYGEAAFKGVKIETISFIVKSKKAPVDNEIKVESYITKEVRYRKQGYILSSEFPYWLLYRDHFFDNVCSKLRLNIFTAFRDRQITKSITKSKGELRVLKSRNIASNKIINIKGYDCYIDDSKSLAVSKYLNHEHAILVPNLTYNPRACFLPNNTLTDGSVAILTLKNGSRKVTTTDLSYYNTDEFQKYYMIARNFGTRSLNIDNNSVFFFGIKSK